MAPALLLVFGRRVVDECRERDFGVDDDVLLLGQVQHHVGPQVASFGILDIVLRFVVDAFQQRRIVQNGLQQHFAPVALHLGVAFEGVGQVLCVGRDRAVEFLQPLQFVLQLSALRGLRGVDFFHAFAKLRNVVLERFEQQIDRFLARLPEALRLLAQYLGRQVAEPEPQGLLLLVAALFLRFAFFSRAAAQGFEFGFGADALVLAFGAGGRQRAYFFFGCGFFCRQPLRFAPLGRAGGRQGCRKSPEEDQGDDKGRVHTHEGSK